MKLKLILLISPVILASCGGGSIPSVKYKLEFNGIHCLMKDDSGTSYTEKEFGAGEIARFHLIGETSGYEIPLKNHIDVKETSSGKDFSNWTYNQTNGDISITMTTNITLHATSDKPEPTDYEVILPAISGLSITQTHVDPGESLEAIISIDNTESQSKPQGLPHSLSSVVIGTKTLLETEYNYKVNPGRESASIFIDSSKIDNDINLNFVTNDLEWFENHYYLSSLEQTDITSGEGVVQELIVNGLKHKVRLIGVEEDVDPENNPIHTTWEFVNLISDSQGYSLATQWNDTNEADVANHDYLNSSLRAALNGEGGGRILWAQKGNQWSDVYTTSVLDMLPGDLVDVLVAPKKSVMCNVSGSQWTEEEIVNKDGDYDKLFFPTWTEMGFLASKDEAYTYYYGCTESIDSKRIKTHFHPDVLKDSSTEIPYNPQKGHKYEGTVDNYAGCNYATDGSKGSLYWLMRPNTTDGFSQIAEDVADTGKLSYGMVQRAALGVAPCFCI